jgi:hypothetical protein
VGITPPKVLGAAKPTSSVIISRIFGAPLGGTTRAGHAGLEHVKLNITLKFPRRSRQVPAIEGGGVLR